ncbi:MAG: hypothetical protein ACYTET_03485 [Planctomycetota bacterium]|jgi:hypothetical protein
MREKKFIALIQDISKGEAEGRDVYADIADFYVNKNDSYSWFKKKRSEDGFLFYKYIIEVYPKNGDDFPAFIHFIKNLIMSLKDNGAKVVPASDFEDELNSMTV